MMFVCGKDCVNEYFVGCVYVRRYLYVSECGFYFLFECCPVCFSVVGV